MTKELFYRRRRQSQERGLVLDLDPATMAWLRGRPEGMSVYLERLIAQDREQKKPPVSRKQRFESYQAGDQI